jgi:phosphotransferase system HPr (HPr) family protein
VKDAVQEIEVEIRNAQGLHLRPAMQIVDLAGAFKSDITVSNDKNTADAKSIMQMMSIVTPYGTRLKVQAQGNDAREALEAIRQLVEEKLFGEPPPEPASHSNER